MRDPAHMVQIGRDRRVPTCEGQRHMPLQRRVAACRIGVNLEVGKRPFQITGIPEWHRVQKCSPHRSDPSFDERMGEGHMRHGLEFVDLQNPRVRPPLVRLEERIRIGAEMPRCALTLDGNVKHAADIGGRDARCTPTPTRRRVNWSMTTSTQ